MSPYEKSKNVEYTVNNVEDEEEIEAGTASKEVIIVMEDNFVRITTTSQNSPAKSSSYDSLVTPSSHAAVINDTPSGTNDVLGSTGDDDEFIGDDEIDAEVLFEATTPKSLTDLLEDRRTETEANLYGCVMCPHQTDTKDRMVRHIQRLHFNANIPDHVEDTYGRISREPPLTAFSCDKCKHVESSKDGLKRHKLVVHLGFVHHCWLCPYVAYAPSDLRGHIKYKHRGKMSMRGPSESVRRSLYECEVGTIPILTEKQLTRHTSPHGGLCFANSIGSKTAERTFEKQRIEPLLGCPLCLFKCISPDRMKTHIAASHPPQQGKSRQIIDDKDSSNDTSISNPSSVLIGLKCDFCLGILPNQDRLRDHLEKCISREAMPTNITNSPPPQQPKTGEKSVDNITTISSLPSVSIGLKCDFCPEILSDLDRLSDHLEARHEESACVPCSLCNHVALSEAHLTDHIAREHRYRCQLCRFATSDQNILMTHKRASHAASLHFCEVCNFSCEQASGIARHKRKQHAY